MNLNNFDEITKMVDRPAAPGNAPSRLLEPPAGKRGKPILQHFLLFSTGCNKKHCNKSVYVLCLREI